MEMIVIGKEELRSLLKSEINEALKNRPEQPPINPLKSEGDIAFALEILKAKAGINSKPTIWRFSHEGRIPCTKRGKKLWFNREELESWIESGMPHVGQQKASNRLSNLPRKTA